MSSPGPELSSLNAALQEIIQRVSTIALEQRGREDGQLLASELFAIEGVLSSAQRRLEKAFYKRG